MNILDIIIILILGYSLLAGMYKGFLVSGLSLLGFVASWFGAYLSYKALMNVVLSNSTIMGFCGGLLEAESFFEGVNATALVSDMANNPAFTPIAESIGDKIPLIGDAFAKNVNTQAFAATRLTTLAEYLDKTVWTAVFGVISFVIMFALVYVIVTLFINLLNHVVEFPVLRKVDWAVGGVFGLLRGAVVTMLAVILVSYVMTMFLEPDSAALKLIENSKMLSFVDAISFLNVDGIMAKIIGG